MTAPVVQQFFDTPLIAVDVPNADPARVEAVARALADRFTVDVSHPATPQYAWVLETRAVTVAPGEVHPLEPLPGQYWVALYCIDPGDGQGGLAIEDPRRAMMGAGALALDVTAEPYVALCPPVSGELTLFQSFLRHGLRNMGERPQQWLRVTLRARQLS